MNTQEKINKAIELLRHYEPLALKLNPEGYFLAFSGGKDSQLLYLLAKKAGVKFRAYFSNTTNENPNNIHFIRESYKDVKFLYPKKNFYALVSEKGLPTINKRYCCAILKEHAGAGCVVLTGERKEESKKRAKYTAISHQSRNKLRNKDIEEFAEIKHECVKGKDKIRLRPLLEFTEKEVFDILESFAVPLNPCYKNHNRIGCIFCPFAKKQEIEEYCLQFPRAKKTLLKSLQQYLDKSDNNLLNNAEEYFEWWLSKKSIKQYIAEKQQLKMEL